MGKPYPVLNNPIIILTPRQLFAFFTGIRYFPFWGEVDVVLIGA